MSSQCCAKKGLARRDNGTTYKPGLINGQMKFIDIASGFQVVFTMQVYLIDAVIIVGVMLLQTLSYWKIFIIMVETVIIGTFLIKIVLKLKCCLVIILVC